MGNNTTSTPSIYKPQSFSKEHQLYAKYGSKPSRKQLRQFNRYWKSDQRYFDEILHDRQEFDRMFESGYRNLEYLRNKYRAKPITKATNTPATSLENKYKDKIKINDYWTNIAKSKGFASMYEVAEWQSKNGLVVDGKFGPASNAFYKSQQKTNTKSGPTGSQPTQNESSSTQTSSPIQSTGYVGNAATSTTNPYRVTSLKPAYSLEDLQNSTYFKKTTGGGNVRLNTHTNRDYILVEGVPYVVIETTGDFDRNSSGILPYDWYAYNPSTGLIRRLAVSWGTPYSGRAHDSKYGSIEGGTWAEGSEWKNPKTLFDTLGYVARSNPKAPSVTPGTNYKKHNIYKNGGNMNKIKYFQQGGTAPQQNLQEQIVALVQAAAQGDEQATKQITQIMEAAKSGNKQAIQLAQMIQQTIEQMKSQATAAKWGAKLGYIKSLKYAKGGKTCPACEKKVEMKACGGKKAKKHYFGGLI